METEIEWICDRMKLYDLMQTQPSWSARQPAAVIGRSERWGRPIMATRCPGPLIRAYLFIFKVLESF